MTAIGLNANIIDVVRKIIKELRTVDMSLPKIFIEPSCPLVRTCLHSMVQAVYCYARRVTLGAYYKVTHACKHVDQVTGEINCGYVIGYAVYKWLISALEPELAIHDLSTGCIFMHDRASTKVFQDHVTDYLNHMIPDPRRDDCYKGFIKIKNYVESVFNHYAPTADRVPILYKESSMSSLQFKDAIVFDLNEIMKNRNATPVRKSMKIILTRDDDIFIKPEDVVKKAGDSDDDCN